MGVSERYIEALASERDYPGAIPDLLELPAPRAAIELFSADCRRWKAAQAVFNSDQKPGESRLSGAPNQDTPICA